MKLACSGDGSPSRLRLSVGLSNGLFAIEELMSALVSGAFLAEGRGFEPRGALRPQRFSSSLAAVTAGVIGCGWVPS